MFMAIELYHFYCIPYSCIVLPFFLFDFINHFTAPSSIILHYTFEHSNHFVYNVKSLLLSIKIHNFHCFFAP